MRKLDRIKRGCETMASSAGKASRTDLPMMPVSAPGRGSVWRHYKEGTLYQVICVARSSEDPGEFDVIYVRMREGHLPADDIWHRRLITMPGEKNYGWLNVLDDENMTHRFRHVSGPRSWIEE